jgi:hypothetical protein
LVFIWDLFGFIYLPFYWPWFPWAFCPHHCAFWTSRCTFCTTSKFEWNISLWVFAFVNNFYIISFILYYFFLKVIYQYLLWILFTLLWFPKLFNFGAFNPVLGTCWHIVRLHSASWIYQSYRIFYPILWNRFTYSFYLLTYITYFTFCVPYTILSRLFLFQIHFFLPFKIFSIFYTKFWTGIFENFGHVFTTCNSWSVLNFVIVVVISSLIVTGITLAVNFRIASNSVV